MCCQNDSGYSLDIHSFTSRNKLTPFISLFNEYEYLRSDDHITVKSPSSGVQLFESLKAPHLIFTIPGTTHVPSMHASMSSHIKRHANLNKC